MRSKKLGIEAMQGTEAAETAINIMSVAAYAKLRGVAERTIRYQIEKNVIEVLPDGRIDAEQADEAWWIQRNARSTLNSEAGRRNAQAKLIDARVRVRLARYRLEEMRDRFIDRADTLAQIAAETETFVAELQAIPPTHETGLALDLHIEERVARVILERFVGLIVGEIGDLETSGAALVDIG
jgi:hypothetical protein